MRSARLAIFLVLILLGLGLAAGYYFINRPQFEADRLRSLATWGLADYLARTRPGAKVLVLSNPFATRQNMEKSVVEQELAGIEGLKSGFNGKMDSVKVVYPELLADAFASPQSLIPDSSVTTPLSFLMTPEALSRLRQEHPDHDLWVSLIGLPVGISNQEVWKMDNGPTFALLLPDLRVIGGVKDVKNAVRSGKLVAFVLTKQGKMFDTRSIGQDLRREFDDRYLLVTAENVEAIVEEYPELFLKY